jgi:hypothetical protein
MNKTTGEEKLIITTGWHDSRSQTIELKSIISEIPEEIVEETHVEVSLTSLNSPGNSTSVIGLDSPALNDGATLIPISSPIDDDGNPIAVKNLINNEMVKAKSLDKTEKKKEPQTLSEYIDFFYQGKVKNLSESFVFRLSGTSQNLRPEDRSALQRSAITADASLEKTRQLMQIARSANSNLILKSTLLDFAKDLVALHPVVKSSALGRTTLFPDDRENVKPLQTIWAELHKGAKESKSAKGYIEKNELPSDLSIESDSDANAALDTKNNPSKDFPKARRNAFLCAVLWRHIEGEAFSSIMRVVQETFFLLKKEPTKLDDELFESILSFSNVEAEKIGLFIKWSNKNLNEQIFRVERLEQSLSSNVEEVSRLTNETSRQADTITQLCNELVELKESLIAAQSEIAVQKVHTRADFEELRARSLGIIKKEVTDLENVEIALSRPIPKVETAKDVVKAVVDSLHTYIKDLEAKR